MASAMEKHCMVNNTDTVTERFLLQRDSICGYVSDKNSGSKLFLYVVQKDEAYIGAYAIATTEYRNVCSITTLADEALSSTQMRKRYPY